MVNGPLRSAMPCRRHHVAELFGQRHGARPRLSQYIADLCHDFASRIDAMHLLDEL
jgi:hypothetical protein